MPLLLLLLLVLLPLLMLTILRSYISLWFEASDDAKSALLRAAGAAAT